MKYKNEIVALIAKYDDKIKEVNDKLLKTQEENAKLSNVNMECKKQIDILLEKEETMLDVEEI